MDLLCDAIIEVHLKEKRNKKIPGNEWKIVRKVFCDAKSNYCLLYLKKKYFIINYSGRNLTKQTIRINK